MKLLITCYDFSKKHITECNEQILKLHKHAEVCSKTQENEFECKDHTELTRKHREIMEDTYRNRLKDLTKDNFEQLEIRISVSKNEIMVLMHGREILEQDKISESIKQWKIVEKTCDNKNTPFNVGFEKSDYGIMTNFLFNIFYEVQDNKIIVVSKKPVETLSNKPNFKFLDKNIITWTITTIPIITVSLLYSLLKK